MLPRVHTPIQSISYCIPKRRSPKALRAFGLRRPALPVMRSTSMHQTSVISNSRSIAPPIVLFRRHVFHAQRYGHLAHRKLSSRRDECDPQPSLTQSAWVRNSSCCGGSGALRTPRCPTRASRLISHLMPVILRRMNIDATHRLPRPRLYLQQSSHTLNPYDNGANMACHRRQQSPMNSPSSEPRARLRRISHGRHIAFRIVFHNGTPSQPWRATQSSKVATQKRGVPSAAPSPLSPRAKKRNADGLRRRTNANKQQARSCLDVVLTNNHESCEAIPF